mmetsp:Transcript_106883/g.297641  ORF Transcript_106883/g.297641 Transcript_106883/m.297641 type:complete len:335 (-) Transcript_106883:43-1047(-)
MDSECEVETATRTKSNASRYLLVGLGLFVLVGVAVGAGSMTRTQAQASLTMNTMEGFSSFAQEPEACRARPDEVAMFVLGSNTLEQTASRVGVTVDRLRWAPAELPDYQRQFRGLAKGRSHGAVATAVKSRGNKVKGMLVFMPKTTDDRSATLDMMDEHEGVPYQYKRYTLPVNCHSHRKDRSLRRRGSPTPYPFLRTLDAQVYLLNVRRDRDQVVTRQLLGRLKGHSNARYWPYGTYNDGMVSKAYIYAVWTMLQKSWGKGRQAHWTAAEQFPSNTDTPLVMFDQSKCATAGTSEGGQSWKGACPRQEMFARSVLKYKVVDYVRDGILTPVSA